MNADGSFSPNFIEYKNTKVKIDSIPNAIILASVYVSVEQQINKNGTFQNEIDSILKSLGDEKIIESKNILFSDLPAYKIVSSDNETTFIIAFTVSNGKLYLITSKVMNQVFTEKLNGIIDTMISSFKFVDLSKAEWKVYKNSSFEMSYPANWAFEEGYNGIHQRIGFGPRQQTSPFTRLSVEYPNLADSPVRSLDSFEKTIIDEAKNNPSSTPDKLERITILNVPALKYTITNENANQKILFYIFIKNEKLFSFVFESSIKDFSSQSGIFQKMIDSLRI